MEIHFFQNKAEAIRVEKSTFLNDRIIMQGNLREQCSIIEPEILVHLNGLPNFNYAYIPEFKRYYYITDITSVRNDLWRVSMQIDTLMSFKNEILNMECIIGRQENDYNPYIKDDNLPLLPEKNVEQIFGTSNVNGFFKQATEKSEPYCYVLTVFDCVETYTGGPQNGETENINYNNLTVAPRLAMSPYTSMASNYAMTHSQIIEFAKEISNFDFGQIIFGSKGEYIINCMLYPFDVIFGQNATEDNIVINQRTMNAKGVRIQPPAISGNYNSSIGSYYAVDAIKIDPHYKNGPNLFLNFQPYSDFKLFLPYYGWVEIDPKLFMSETSYGKRDTLWVHISIDYTTGQGLYRLSVGYEPNNQYYNQTVEIELIEFQLGVSVPFSSNNRAEWANNLIVGSIKTGLDVATLGIASKRNTLQNSKSRGRISKRAKQKSALKTAEMSMGITEDYIDTLTQPMDYKSINGAGNGFNMFAECSFPYIVQEYSIINEPTDYAKIYGRPSMKTAVLSTLSGFTKCYDFHLENFPTATIEEIEEIESRLYEGIIL